MRFHRAFTGLIVVLAAFTLVACGTKSLKGYEETITSMAWSPDGTMLATGSQDNTVLVRNVSNGREIISLPLLATNKCVAWSPDGTKLAVAQSQSLPVWIVDMESKTVALALGEFPRDVVHMAWSPDGTMLAIAPIGQTIDLWDVSTGGKIRVLEGQAADVSSIAWSPDGKILASSTWGEVILWDTATGEILHTIEAAAMMANLQWSSDGTILSFTEKMNENSEFILWELSSRTQVKSIKIDIYQIFASAWSPDGSKLAIAGQMYNQPSKPLRIIDVSTGEILRSMEYGSSEYVNRLAWSPDGKTLAGSIEADDRVIMLWEFGSP